MAYQVLARKWRPRNFHEMVGQQHVLTALTHALDQGRLHHAYLLSGTRGVGKTTIARILAKCLNCETGISSQPCGQCDSCREIDQGNFVDLLEIDAASRTKVEDTRELLDNVQYRPARGRFKVYLIDEVHMLSRHSFNALLKTLEEPPPYVKFVLATTDPQKLPITILSRCLQFHLKSLSREQIVSQLAHILEAEGQPFEPAALPLLAKAADGSMRDALSLTDQALAYGNGQVHRDQVLSMLGTLDQRHLHGLLHHLADGDGAAMLAKIAEICSLGPDFDQLHAELAGLLHRIALTQLLGSSPDTLASDGAEVQQLAARLAPQDVQLYYQMALTGRKELPFAPDGRAGLEMSLLRMLAFAPASVETASAPQVPQRSGPLHSEAVPSSRGSLGSTSNLSAPSVALAHEPAVLDSVAEEVQVLQPLIDEQAQLEAEADRWRQERVPTPSSLTTTMVSEPAVASTTPEVVSTSPDGAAPSLSGFANAPLPEAAAKPEEAGQTSGSDGLAKMLQLRNRLRSQRQGEAAEPSPQPRDTPRVALSQPDPVTRPAPVRGPATPAETAVDGTTARAERGAPVAQSKPQTTPASGLEPPPWDDIPLSAYEDLVSQGEPESAAPASTPQEPSPPKPEGPRQAPMSPASLSPPPAKTFTSAPTQAPPAVNEADGEAGELWQSDDLLRDCGDPWAELMVAAGIRGRLRQLCLNASCDTSGHPWRLLLSPEHRHLVSERAIIELANQLSAHLGQPVQLQVSLAGPERPTPLHIERQRYAALHHQAEQALAADPHVQFMIERFGAELDADSIQPLKSC